MNREMPCEACGEAMREIDPYASVKAEGRPSEKFDGKRQFECIQDGCENSGKVIELDATSEESYQEKVQKQCNCGHVRFLHGHRFHSIEPGQPMQKRNKDGECEATNCECKSYTPSQPS